MAKKKKTPKKKSVRFEGWNKNQKKKETSKSSAGKPIKGAGAKSSGNRVTSMLIQWHDVKFIANAKQVYGIIDLTISASCETEDKTENGEKYVALKNKKGWEVSLTAVLDKRLGIKDVQTEGLKLARYAAEGQTGYFYSQGKKLLTSNMMATSGKIQKIQIAPSGIWIACEVNMTFKACSKLGGEDTGSGGSGGSGGGGNGRTYKVQIAGMSELKVYSYSVQGAITKACGTKYTGYVMVDGTQYYVKDGKIDNERIPETKEEELLDEATEQGDQAKEESGGGTNPPPLGESLCFE